MTSLFVGERLVHPAITRSVDAFDAGSPIRYAIAGPLDREIASVLGRVIRIDLLAARGLHQRATFVLDLAQTLDIEPRALDSLKSLTRLVMEEMGSVVFENVPDDVHQLLVIAHYDRVFTIHRAGPV